MKCVVKSKAGYYARIDGQPRWVQTKGEAKVFRTVKLARGLVRILADRRIKAVVEPAAETR